MKKLKSERKQKLKQWSILKLQTTMRKWIARKTCRVRRTRMQQSTRLGAVVDIQRIVRGFVGRRRARQRKLLLSINIWVQLRLGDADAVEDAYNGVDTEQPLNAEVKDAKGNTLLIVAARHGHLKVRSTAYCLPVLLPL